MARRVRRFFATAHARARGRIMHPPLRRRPSGSTCTAPTPTSGTPSRRSTPSAPGRQLLLR
eukprot:1153191-Pyramimonas_sp.AAC.1